MAAQGTIIVPCAATQRDQTSLVWVGSCQVAATGMTRSHKTLFHAKFIKGKDAGGFYTTAETSNRKLNNTPKKSSLTKNDVYDSIALLGVSGQSDGIMFIKLFGILVK